MPLSVWVVKLQVSQWNDFGLQPPEPPAAAELQHNLCKRIKTKHYYLSSVIFSFSASGRCDPGSAAGCENELPVTAELQHNICKIFK